MAGWMGAGGILFLLLTARRGIFPRLGKAVLSALLGVAFLAAMARWVPFGPWRVGINPLTVGTIAVLGLPGLLFVEAVRFLLH